MTHDPLRIMQTPDAPPGLRRALHVASRLNPTPEDIERLICSLTGPRLVASTDETLELRQEEPMPSSRFVARRPARRRRTAFAAAACILAATLSLTWAGVRLRLWGRAFAPNVEVKVPQSVQQATPPPRFVPFAANGRSIESLPPATDEPADLSKGTERRSRYKPSSRAPASLEVESKSEISAPAEPQAVPTEAAPKEPSEVQLLFQARRSLGSDPAQTLRWVVQHERRFPSGKLVQEREMLAIQALQRLGRTEEANARIARFRERFPSSIHGQRVETGSAGRPPENGLVDLGRSGSN
jgi:hypothetical protein